MAITLKAARINAGLRQIDAAICIDGGDEMAITLKAARINAGLRQVDAAIALNISKNTLANYENYKTVPDIETAKKIAALYGLSVDDIIFFDERLCFKHKRRVKRAKSINARF